MKLIAWTPVLFCFAAVVTAEAAKDARTFPAVPEDVSMIADDNMPKGYFFQSSFGTSFYFTDADGKDKSTCFDKCAETWGPVQARKGAEPIGTDWKLIDRPEGYKQWSYQGHPIYVSVGEVMQQGKPSLPKTWHELTP